MTRTVILKLTAAGHGYEGTSAAHNLLIKGIILQIVGRDVLGVLVLGQNFVVQLAHLIHLVVEQLKCVVIGIGGDGDECQSYIVGGFRSVRGHEVGRHQGSVLNGGE